MRGNVPRTNNLIYMAKVFVKNGSDIRVVMDTQAPGFQSAGFQIVGQAPEETSIGPYFGSIPKEPSYKDIVTGNVGNYSPAPVDPLEETYLDEMFRQIETESTAQKRNTQESYGTLVGQLKESRDLWNKDLEKTYGRTLEKANVSVYDRGIQDSGIRGQKTTEISENKAYTTEQRDLLEKQKQEIADQDLKQRLESIARSEERSRSSYKSPYAAYSYIK